MPGSHAARQPWRDANADWWERYRAGIVAYMERTDDREWWEKTGRSCVALADQHIAAARLPDRRCLPWYSPGMDVDRARDANTESRQPPLTCDSCGGTTFEPWAEDERRSMCATCFHVCAHVGSPMNTTDWSPS